MSSSSGVTHTPSGGVCYGAVVRRVVAWASVTVCGVTVGGAEGRRHGRGDGHADGAASGDGGLDSVTYTVALATQPTAAVTVAVGGDGHGDVTVDRSSLTFSDLELGHAADGHRVVRRGRRRGGDAAVTVLTHTPSGGGYGAVPSPA